MGDLLEQPGDAWARYDGRVRLDMDSDPFYSEVPNEIRGWNWGAFLLTWIWGLGNRVWQAMYVFIPIYGFFYMFVLGSRGNEFAWNSREWNSVEEFKATQRKWALGGLAFAVLWVGLLGVIFIESRYDNQKTIGDNPECLDGRVPRQTVSCGSSEARYEIIYRGTDISDCRDYRAADTTSTSADSDEVLCLRTIPDSSER